MAGTTIGAVRVVLGANTANFEAGMRRAKKEAATSATAIQRSLSGIKAGFAGAATGIVSGAVLGSLVSLTKRGLEYAGSLGEISQQLGVTTSTLQVYRQAGAQAGATTEEIDKAIAKLTKTAGDAADGVKTAEDSFTRLGISVTDAQGNIKSTDSLLGEIADKLAKIPSPAERASIEVDYFGKAGQRLDPLLTQGSKGVEAVRKEMEKLGIVLSDEQIQNADRTADKLQELSNALDAKIAGTISNNASAIYDLASALADLAGMAIRAAGAWLKFSTAIGSGNTTAGAMTTIGGPLGIIAGLPGVITGLINGPQDPGVTRMIKDVTDSGGTRRVTQTPRTGGGGGRNKADDAQRKREQEIRRQADIERDLTNAKIDELRAQQDLEPDYTARAEIQKQIIDAETDQKNSELATSVKLGDMDDATARLLQESNERLRIAQKLKVVDDIELDRQRDFEETERTMFGIQRDMMEAQRALAETASERRAVELQILEAAYTERRQALQRIVDESKNAEAINRARQELAALPAQRAADTAVVMQGTRGPLEQFSAGLPTTAAKMNEALQSVAANGLQALEDGIISVIDGTKKVGEAFRDMASQIISELLRIQIEKMLIGPASGFFSKVLGVASAVGGSISGGAGGGPVISSHVGNPFGSFDSGGFTGFMPRKRVAGVVHGNEFVFDADATARLGVGNLEALRRGVMRPANDSTTNVINFGGININAPMSPRQARETGNQAAAAIQRRIAMTKRNGM